MTYRLTAKFYDLFGSKNDLIFYRTLALKCGKKALELGVGTARVAIVLAKAGVNVVGVDNSVPMLNIAKEKLARESKIVQNRVTLTCGDMRDFDLDQSFPFIYIPASTFDHNITVEARKQTLNCIYKHLEKNGTLAFDLENPISGLAEKSWWIDRKEADEGRMVVRSIFTKRNTSRRTLSLDLFYDVYDNGKSLERYHEYGEVSIVSRDEIVQLLEENGFEIVSVFGDFDKSEYCTGSPKIVLVTKRI